MLFDTHAHLDDPRFNADQEEVIQRAQEAGVDLILNVGYNLPSARRTVELTEKYDFIYGAVGMHPHDAKDLNGQTIQELKIISQKDKIKAIGEIGLDYFWNHSPKEVQQKVFRIMIDLAKRVKLPIIIHDRDAHEDVLRIIREEGAKDVGGVFHCFSGSWEMAKEILKLGFYISFAGPVTFHNARKLQEVALQAPLDFLLIETDSPYLAPMPYRGKRNESAHVLKVAERIAEIKGLDLMEVANITMENGKRLFQI